MKIGRQWTKWESTILKKKELAENKGSNCYAPSSRKSIGSRRLSIDSNDHITIYFSICSELDMDLQKSF
jgi:hypothetical protein